MNSFIDTHAHLSKNVDWTLMDEIAGSGIVKQVWLQHCPIQSGKGLPLADEDEVLTCCSRYPGMYVPFGFIDYTKGPDEIARLKDKGFFGLKAISAPKAYDDESYFPIYTKAEELGMPILFHVGIIAKGFWQRVDSASFPGPGRMKPSMLDSISDAFPKLRLIQGHMGVPWLNELWESLYYYPNVSCSVCGLIDFEWLIQNLDRRCADKTPMADRMMFAVDGLYGHRDYWQDIPDTARFMEEFFQRVGRTYNWGARGRDFMENNAAKLMESLKTL